MHPFTPGCSAAECSFVLARLHGNSAQVKIVEAGGGIPDIPPPSGPEETLLGEKEQRGLTELQMSEWSRTAGWFTAQRIKHIKME